jgi:ABC-type glycerol-3-phosphate transport system substrate-binding protein
MRRLSRLTLAVVVSCLVLTAGCGGFAGSSSQMTETVEDPQTTSTATTADEMTSATNNATATTTTISYTEGIETDLRISNSQNQSQTVKVDVTAENGTVVFEEEVSVGPDESLTFNISYPGAGTYAVTAVAGNESAVHEYDIQSSDPGTRIGVVLVEDGIRIDEEAV